MGARNRNLFDEMKAKLITLEIEPSSLRQDITGQELPSMSGHGQRGVKLENSIFYPGDVCPIVAAVPNLDLTGKHALVNSEGGCAETDGDDFGKNVRGGVKDMDGTESKDLDTKMVARAVLSSNNQGRWRSIDTTNGTPQEFRTDVVAPWSGLNELDHDQIHVGSAVHYPGNRVSLDNHIDEKDRLQTHTRSLDKRQVYREAEHCIKQLRFNQVNETQRSRNGHVYNPASTDPADDSTHTSESEQGRGDLHDKLSGQTLSKDKYCDWPNVYLVPLPYLNWLEQQVMQLRVEPKVHEHTEKENTIYTCSDTNSPALNPAYHHCNSIPGLPQLGPGSRPDVFSYFLNSCNSNSGETVSNPYGYFKNGPHIHNEDPTKVIRQQKQQSTEEDVNPTRPRDDANTAHYPDRNECSGERYENATHNATIDQEHTVASVNIREPIVQGERLPSIKTNNFLLTMDHLGDKKEKNMSDTRGRFGSLSRNNVCDLEMHKLSSERQHGTTVTSLKTEKQTNKSDYLCSEISSDRLDTDHKPHPLVTTDDIPGGKLDRWSHIDTNNAASLITLPTISTTDTNVTTRRSSCTTGHVMDSSERIDDSEIYEVQDMKYAQKSNPNELNANNVVFQRQHLYQAHTKIDTWNKDYLAQERPREVCTLPRITDPKQFGSLAHMRQLKEENKRYRMRLKETCHPVDDYKHHSTLTSVSQECYHSPEQSSSASYPSVTKANARKCNRGRRRPRVQVIFLSHCSFVTTFYRQLL